MDANELKRELDVRADQQRQQIHHEINRLRYGLLDEMAARWVVMRAMMEELDTAQRQRVQDRAIDLAGAARIKARVLELFNPEADDED